MRLHQSGRDAEIGFDESAIERHERAARRRLSEREMLVVISCEVVEDRDVLQDPRITDQFLQFVFRRQAGAGPSPPGWEMGVLRHPGFDQRVDERPQEQMDWERDA